MAVQPVVGVEENNKDRRIIECKKLYRGGHMNNKKIRIAVLLAVIAAATGLLFWKKYRDEEYL